jgi:hypothetical protein
MAPCCAGALPQHPRSYQSCICNAKSTRRSSRPPCPRRRAHRPLHRSSRSPHCHRHGTRRARRRHTARVAASLLSRRPASSSPPRRALRAPVVAIASLGGRVVAALRVVIAASSPSRRLASSSSPRCASRSPRLRRVARHARRVLAAVLIDLFTARRGRRIVADTAPGELVADAPRALSPRRRCHGARRARRRHAAARGQGWPAQGGGPAQGELALVQSKVTSKKSVAPPGMSGGEPRLP